ncbi:MAG: glycerol-3-phosphate acyltransferase, partial [Trueperaceae bacterium]
MDTVLVWVVSLILAYIIGSLPLGAWLVRAASGFDPRDVNPHLLGVENVYKLVGPVVAVSSFLLDIFKGLVAVMVGALVAMWSVGVPPLTLDPLAGLTLSLPGGFAGFFSAAANAPEALGAAAGMAFFGVLLGHLHPVPLRGLVSVPRGRGNGVVVGALAALFGLGALPFWLGALAIAVYAAVL